MEVWQVSCKGLLVFLYLGGITVASENTEDGLFIVQVTQDIVHKAIGAYSPQLYRCEVDLPTGLNMIQTVIDNWDIDEIKPS